MKPFRRCGSKFILTNRKMLYVASFIVNTSLQIVLLNILVKHQSHSDATLTSCTLFVTSSFKIFYDYMYNFRICLSYLQVSHWSSQNLLPLIVMDKKDMIVTFR